MNEPPISLLIVDDDPVFSLFVQQLILSLGDKLRCNVNAVGSAEAAQAAIRGRSYDLALLDYHLPCLSGLDLLDQIRSLPVSQQPAVIMLTGSGNEMVAVQAMKRGAKDYLQKNSLDEPSLMRAIQTALTQKRLAEQVAVYHGQINADLEMARRLQLALLPQTYPAFPANASNDKSALCFHHRNFSAAQLGGDFFSVQSLSDTEAGVLICDVMGHGVRSALVTAMLRAMVGETGAQARDPGLFLSQMNRKLAAILKQIDEPLYATAFYLVADTAKGTMRYAKAGHPSPFHLHRRLGTVTQLHLPEHAGAGLGLFGNTSYITGECQLSKGDAVLLFTDGLYEVPNAEDEDYGERRLLCATKERLNLPLPELLDALIAEVRSHSGSGDFDDDVCLLGMEVVGDDRRE